MVFVSRLASLPIMLQFDVKINLLTLPFDVIDAVNFSFSGLFCIIRVSKNPKKSYGQRKKRPL